MANLPFFGQSVVICYRNDLGGQGSPNENAFIGTLTETDGASIVSQTDSQGVARNSFLKEGDIMVSVESESAFNAGFIPQIENCDIIASPITTAPTIDDASIKGTITSSAAQDSLVSALKAITILPTAPAGIYRAIKIATGTLTWSVMNSQSVDFINIDPTTIFSTTPTPTGTGDIVIYFTITTAVLEAVSYNKQTRSGDLKRWTLIALGRPALSPTGIIQKIYSDLVATPKVDFSPQSGGIQKFKFEFKVHNHNVLTSIIRNK